MATSFRSQASVQVIIILSIVVALLIGIIVLMWLRSKKTQKYIPHGWVLEPKEIVSMLDSAAEQRSKFELQFHSENDKRRSTICSLYELGKDTLTVECSGLKNISARWIGREIDGYFRLQDENRNTTFYSFTAPIAGIKNTGNQVSLISLSLPQKLEKKQKRAFLRVDPPEQYILGIAMWPEHTLSDGSINLNLKSWGKPALTFIPGRRAQVRMDNISAGGVKLKIKRQDAKESGFEFNIGDHIMLLLDLWEPENGQRMRFWLQCRVQNPFVDFETRDVELGLQFLKRAAMKENSNQDLEWVPMMANEVDEIGNWTMKRHLELYREKGLE